VGVLVGYRKRALQATGFGSGAASATTSTRRIEHSLLRGAGSMPKATRSITGARHDRRAQQRPSRGSAWGPACGADCTLQMLPPVQALGDGGTVGTWTLWSLRSSPTAS
jgi:hypothetical protein